jgi:hypothetical protein
VNDEKKEINRDGQDKSSKQDAKSKHHGMNAS